MYASLALLLSNFQEEVRAKDQDLRQERERLLEVSRNESTLVSRLEGEESKCEGLTKQATELELKLTSLTTELEAERVRCKKLQSGLGQRSEE